MLSVQQCDANVEVSINLDIAFDLVKSMRKVFLVQRSINTAFKEGLPAIKDFLSKIVELCTFKSYRNIEHLNN